MAHMMTRMTRWLDSHDSLARWLAVCQDPPMEGESILNYGVVLQPRLLKA